MSKRLLLWLIALAFFIILLLILPGLAKHYIVNHSKDYLGRKFSIEHIRVNYFTAKVRIIGFKLYEPDDKTVFVSFDQFLVNLQPLNALKKEIVIEQLHLDGLYTHIVQQDSTFNFDDIIAFLNKPSDSLDTGADTTPSKPWGFRMSDFELNKANFIFDDRNVKKATHIRDFSLNVPYIAWEEGESNAGIKFTTARDGYFESSLQIDPVQGDYLANVTIRNLHLDNFQEYISYYSGVKSLTGLFNCQVKLAGNINIPEQFILSGLAQFQDLMMTDTSGSKFIGAEQVDIGLKNIDYIHSRYELDSLILTGPYLHFILWDSTDNITQAIVYSQDETFAGTDVADTSLADTSGQLYYSVDKFAIRNGTVDYTDHLTDQPFDYHLTEIVLEADSITTDMKQVNLFSRMLLNERGVMKAKATFDPNDPTRNIALDYVISDFLLTDLNIYSRFYMGFPILLGDMYYKSSTTIVDGQLNSENKLIMTNVELGEKGGGLYDVPIKLALFILKDRYGVINLDVPVRGNLDDPSLKFGKLIWTTFKNLMVKVATAPFDALAGQIGADPKDLEAIEYDYLDTLLTPQRQKQLDLLIQLEKQKPGLGIEMVYYNDINAEIGMIYAGNSLLTSEDIQVQASQMKNARIEALTGYLKALSPSTQIKISVANPQDPGNTATRPVFRISYTLADNP